MGRKKKIIPPNEIELKIYKDWLATPMKIQELAKKYGLLERETFDIVWKMEKGKKNGNL